MKNKKAKVYIGIDSNINEILDNYVEENIIDKSKLIEILIKKFLEEKKLINEK